MQRRLLFGLTIVLGLVFTFLVPPFQKPDENRHYYQAQALSHLTVTCQRDPKLGVYLPVPESAYNFPLILKTSEIAQTPDVKFFRSQFGWYPFPKQENTIKATDWCSWSFVGYVPAAIGLTLGRLSGSLMIQFYLARLVSLLVFLTALSYGLKLTPPIYQKWLWFFALLPMTLHQVSAISYDAVLLSMVPIIYGFVTRWLAPPRQRITRSMSIIFYLSLLVIVLTKPVMVTFLLFYFLLPHKPTKLLVWPVAFALILIVPFLHPLHYRDLTAGIDPVLQQQLVLHDPLYFASILMQSLATDLPHHLEGIVGRLGWLDYRLNPMLYYLAVAVFGYLLSSPRGQSTQVNKHTFWTIFFVVITTTVATYGALYLTWSRVGESLIVGVQGRYLLPLVPFVGLWLSLLITYTQYSRKVRLILISLLGFWLLSQVTLAIYSRYFDYSHYGTNDLELSSLPPHSTTLDSTTFTLPLPANQAKVVGFYFYPSLTTPGNTYHYALASADCRKVYRTGYLDLYGEPEGVARQIRLNHPVIISEGKFCLRLRPLDADPSHQVKIIAFPNGDLIRPLYLIPSLR